MEVSVSSPPAQATTSSAGCPGDSEAQSPVSQVLLLKNRHHNFFDVIPVCFFLNTMKYDAVFL